ncbi:MAG: translocation/assembly module TamB domain-containing protein [Luteibaculaceae bacterium]
MQIVRVLGYVFGILIVVALSVATMLYLLSISGTLQTRVAQWVASYMSKQLDTEVQIKSIKVRPFKTLNLQGVYVADQQHDTLFYLGKLEVDLRWFNREKQNLAFNEVSIEQATFRYIRNSEKDSSNLDFILAYFSAEPKSEDETTEPSSFSISLSRFKIANSTFIYHDLADTTETQGINFSDLEIRKIGLNATRVDIKSTTYRANIKNLQFTEKSGFNLKKLEAITLVSSSGVELTGLTLLANRSELFGEFNLRFNEWENFADFSNAVSFETSLFNSIVNLGDIGFFAEDFYGADFNVWLSGNLFGPLNDFRLRNLNLSTLSSTLFNGNITLKNVTEPEKMTIRAMVNRLETNYTDLIRIPLPPFNEGKFIELSEDIALLGDITSRGSFNGSLNDFKCDLTLDSRLGQVIADLAMQFNPRINDYNYQGKVSTQNFQLSKFAQSDILGAVSAELMVVGSGLSANNIDVEALGRISKINLKNYNYEKIRLDGRFKQNYFKGNLKVDDPNFMLDFNGEISFTEQYPETDFYAQLYHWNLVNTNWDTTNTFSSLSADLRLQTRGSNFQNLEGIILGDNIKYCVNELEYDFGFFEIEKSIDDKNRLFTINSNLLDVKLLGDFNPEKINENIQQVFHQVFPDYVPARENLFAQNFNLTVDFKDINPLLEVLLPTLQIAPKTALVAGFSSQNDSLFLTIKSPEIKFNGIPIRLVDLKTEMHQEALSLELNTRNVILSDSLRLPFLKLRGKAKNNNGSLDIFWSNADSSNAGFIPIRGMFLDADHIFTEILPGKAIINGNQWDIPSIAQINYLEREFSISNLVITGKNQQLFFNGHLGTDVDDRLNFKFENLGLAGITNLFQDSYALKGVINAEGFLGSALDEPILVAMIDVNDLIFDGTYLGDLSIGSKYNTADNSVVVNGKLLNNDFERLTIEGKYLIRDKFLSLGLQLEDQPIDILNPFTEGIISNTTGSISGVLTAQGPLGDLELRGELEIENGSTKVDYLGTTYIFSDKIRVEPDWIGFDRMRLTDERGNTGIAVGTIIHNKFKDWNFDISIDVENFMALNTEAEDNDLFYGTALVTGNIGISGLANNLDLNVDVRSEQGTRLNMPLGGSNTVELKPFVRFISEEEGELGSSKVDLEGITMNFRLDIRDNAQINLVFDETIGDVMRANGSGVIEMVITPTSDFFMYGTYTVRDGSYLFTLRNLINKRFRIAPGGTIKWFGDPLAAELDLATIYNVRVPLYDIILDNPEQYRRRVPVEVYLKLQGALTQPEISFDIKAPTVDENARAQLRTAIEQEDERNRQVFALLLLNKFLPVMGQGSEEFTGGASGAQLGAATTAEMLSNQLSNWVNQISSDFDIGINYRPGDAISNEEIAVALSTQLFNDRLSFSGNFGVSQGNDLNQNPNSIVGDFLVEYMITEDGRFRLKVFNESNDFNLTNVNQAPYTQGVGVFYQQDFDTFKEFLDNLFKFKKDREASQKRK